MTTTYTTTQLLVLGAYFLAVYCYKVFATSNIFPEKGQAFLRGMIPAFNLICGLLLGYFGVAGLDVTAAVLGSLATGGAASLISMPSKLAKTTVKDENSNTQSTDEQPV